jgi:RsiW-degrading membrane proteinase PrsW (M82 family)/predicted RNA-binding Zn-ribbon protein involved in translation (DUF1610 family)
VDTLLLFTVGFAPGVFWLWYFYRKDRYEPEPQRLVLRTAFFGILAAIPVTLLEMPFSESFLFAAVIVAPIVEELAKLAVVRWTIYNNKEFNEPMDGMTYAAAAALGFASIENVGYIAHQYSEGGMESAATTFGMRAVLSVPGHVLFSSLWGYALGRSKFQPEEMRSRTVLLGLTLAILAHALFNLFLTIGLFFAVIVLLLPYLWKRLNRNVDELLSGSPFRRTRSPVVATTEVEQKAKEFFLAGSEIPSAANDTPMLPESVQCGACGAEVHLTLSERRRGAYICPACNAFHQQEARSEGGDVAEPLLPHETANSGGLNDIPESEETALRLNLLPERLDCLSCQTQFELSVAERNRGWFVCPRCTFFNTASMLSHVQFRLKPFAVCPSCNAELELTALERKEGEFVCPECSRRTEANTIEDISKIQQYILPAGTPCPACEEKIVLEGFLRNQTEFTCPYCRERIDYVEE